MKENQRKPNEGQVLELCWRSKKTVERENDTNNNRKKRAWNSTEKFEKEAGTTALWRSVRVQRRVLET